MTSAPSPTRPGSTAARAVVVAVLSILGVAVSCTCLFGPAVSFGRPSALEVAAWWAGAAAGVVIPAVAAGLLFKRRRWSLAPALALALVLVVAGIVSYGFSISNAVALA